MGVEAGRESVRDDKVPIFERGPRLVVAAFPPPVPGPVEGVLGAGPVDEGLHDVEGGDGPVWENFTLSREVACTAAEVACTAAGEVACTAAGEVACTAAGEVACTAAREVACTAAREVACTAAREVAWISCWRGRLDLAAGDVANPVVLDVIPVVLDAIPVVLDVIPVVLDVIPVAALPPRTWDGPPGGRSWSWRP